MSLFLDDGDVRLYHGDCLDVLDYLRIAADRLAQQSLLTEAAS